MLSKRRLEEHHSKTYKQPVLLLAQYQLKPY